MWFAKLFGGREDDSEPSEHPPHPAAVASKAVPNSVRPVRENGPSQVRPVSTKKGFDPYNSGTFDRNKAWTRVVR